MDILIGTTNPAKINRFSKLLLDYPVRILTPKDLGITDSPEEDGKNPMENACLKAAFYSQFCQHVICNDSGLYFSDLPFDDPRQPGLHIRTPHGKRLNDEAMIAYYAQLVHSLGGRITAYYVHAIAVSANGVLSVYKDSEAALQDGAFYLLDTPSPKRTPGWPLDSLAIDRQNGLYFVDRRSNTCLPESRIRAIVDQKNFLINALHLEE